MHSWTRIVLILPVFRTQLISAQFRCDASLPSATVSLATGQGFHSALDQKQYEQFNRRHRSLTTIDKSPLAALPFRTACTACTCRGMLFTWSSHVLPFQIPECKVWKRLLPKSEEGGNLLGPPLKLDPLFNLSSPMLGSLG